MNTNSRLVHYVRPEMGTFVVPSPEGLASWADIPRFGIVLGPGRKPDSLTIAILSRPWRGRRSWHLQYWLREYWHRATDDERKAALQDPRVYLPAFA